MFHLQNTSMGLKGTGVTVVFRVKVSRQVCSSVCVARGVDLLYATFNLALWLQMSCVVAPLRLCTDCGCGGILCFPSYALNKVLAKCWRMTMSRVATAWLTGCN
jgi:hypothetical protein